MIICIRVSELIRNDCLHHTHDFLDNRHIYLPTETTSNNQILTTALHPRILEQPTKEMLHRTNTHTHTRTKKKNEKKKKTEERATYDKIYYAKIYSIQS